MQLLLRASSKLQFLFFLVSRIGYISLSSVSPFLAVSELNLFIFRLPSLPVQMQSDAELKLGLFAFLIDFLLWAIVKAYSNYGKKRLFLVTSLFGYHPTKLCFIKASSLTRYPAALGLLRFTYPDFSCLLLRLLKRYKIIQACLKVVKTPHVGPWHLKGLPIGLLGSYFILFVYHIATPTQPCSAVVSLNGVG